MSFKRHTVLMASVFALWSQPYGAHSADAGGGQAEAASPLPGSNSISGLTVKPQEEGRWLVDFDYFFNGDPPDAVIHIDLTLRSPLSSGAPLEYHGPVEVHRLKPGAQHVSTSFDYSSAGTSTQFIVNMTTASSDARVLATQRIDQVVTWPTNEEREFYLARDSISNGEDTAIRQARGILEGLLAKNPQFDPAFLELARIAMKTNWGPEGLHQAQTLIDSALQIRPDNVNAKILLGYVYAHQQRWQEAQALFVEAARSDPPNTWLWTNWGELLEMQGNAAQAIAKYREAIKRPESMEAFGARRNAYDHLLALLQARKDVDAMEALYRQRIGEYGPGSCFSADYARFKLNVRNDPQGAIDLARAALNLNCEDAPSREILGLASYVKWAQANGTESAAALNQARIYLPTGPMALYLLASNDSTLSAARKLLASGESIDQKDNEQMTALGYSLQRGSRLEATERLLQLGARADTPVGMDEMPVALLPVLDRNIEAIRVLQRAGVDYTKLRYRGMTALDFAKQTGDDALLKALTIKERAL